MADKILPSEAEDSLFMIDTTGDSSQSHESQKPLISLTTSIPTSADISYMTGHGVKVVNDHVNFDSESGKGKANVSFQVGSFQRTGRGKRNKGKEKMTVGFDQDPLKNSNHQSASSPSPGSSSPRKTKNQIKKERRAQRKQEDMEAMLDYIQNSDLSHATQISALASLSLYDGGSNERGSGIKIAQEKVLQKKNRVSPKGKKPLREAPPVSFVPSGTTISIGETRDNTDDIELSDSAVSDSNSELPETGYFEYLMEDEDESDKEEYLIYDETDSDSISESDDQSPIQVDGTNDDESDNDDEYLRKEFNFDESGESHSEFEDSQAGPSTQGLSRTQLRKQKKREKKEQLASKRQTRKEREVQSKKIDHMMYKAGSAISDDIMKFLRKINQTIYSFVTDRSEPEYTLLPPMKSPIRRLAIAIAVQYKTYPKTRGSGNRKQTLIYRRKGSMPPENWQNIPDVIVAKEKGRLQRDTNLEKRPAKSEKSKSSTKGPKAASQKRKDHVQRDEVTPKMGTVVGQNAPPVADDNVGRRMLLAMGWKPGQALGSTNPGPVDPIQVVVRSKRGGLGTE